MLQIKHIMGNQDSCCSCSSTHVAKAHQIEAKEENIADLNDENQLEENTIKNSIKKIDFSIRNPIFLDNSSSIGEKIQSLQISNVIQSQQEFSNIQNSRKQELNNQSNSQKQFTSSQKTSKIKNYISFKRSTPRHHYKFLRILNNNYGSHVYEAVNIKNGYKKAIKVKKMKQKENSRNIYKSQSKLYLEENLNHPNLVRLYEVYQHQGNEYLVMELMEGGSLSQVASCRQFKEINKTANIDQFFEELKLIIKQVLYALCYLHDKEIAHLNVQRNNILLSHQFGKKNKSSAKLISFSLCLKKIKNNLSLVQKSHFSHLSEKYLLPLEVIQNSKVSLKTDIWMLGITILQIITGNKWESPKYEQTQRTIWFQNIREYIQKQWKLLQKQLQFFQSHCLDLILKMIQIDPDKRPTPLECLEHPWFLPLDLQQSDENLNQKSRSVLRQTVLAKKSNNLINYIENAIVYKNISQKEMQYISQIFTKLDKDKNGSVQMYQLIEFFQNQRQPKQDNIMFEFCLELVNNLDSDDSGTVDYHQFCKALVNKRMHITKSAIEDIFNHIDTDENGKIVLHQLKNSLQGCDLSELQHYMKQIDTNFDGCLTKNQFIKYCLMKFQERWVVENENQSQARPFPV